jgi:hypothetical protein
MPQQLSIQHDFRVEVDVTTEHVNDAERENSGHCMVAEAIKSALPEARTVMVDLQTIRFSLFEKGIRYIYLTPRPVQEKLLNFDLGEPTGPFRFRLRHPVQVLPIGFSSRPNLTKPVAYTVNRSDGTFAKVGGNVIPGGALPSTVHGRNGKKTTSKTPKTGMRRAFGLRAFGKFRNMYDEEKDAQRIAVEGD